MLNNNLKLPDLGYWSKNIAFRLSAAVSPGTLVLAYHRIAEKNFDPLHLAVSPANFRSQLLALKRHFSVISADRFLSDRQNRISAPRTVMLTFDDGYRDNFTRGLPIMVRHSVPGLFFVTNLVFPPWWDETAQLLTPAELSRFSRHPLVTFGGHTRDHFLLAGLPFVRQLEQIESNYRFLRRFTGASPQAFAYPFGNISFYDAGSVAAVSRFYPLAFTTMPYPVSPLNGNRELPRVLVPNISGSRLITYLARKIPGLSWLTA